MTSEPAFYERPGLNAETYDARTAAYVPSSTVEGDVAFYLAQGAEVGGPVLELGCGTGRVAWALAASGHEVVGLDRSRVMLDQAEAKRPGHPSEAAARMRFVEGDMSAFELQRSFALAIVPYRAFQALLEPELQRACLRATHQALRPGGRLILDLFDPRLDYLVPGATRAAPPRSDGEVRHPTTGRTVEVTVLERVVDPLRQVMEERWRFRELDPGGGPAREEIERLSLRWSYRWEMSHLLELTGYTVLAEYSDFHESPPAYGREQIWVAARG
ncbi:MAG: class I SAM-dependent methyltransferase [Candidatus Limnocylindrales bacterium]